MARALVITLGDYPPEERRSVLMRELHARGGSPAAVARAFGVTVAAVQQWLVQHNLRGEAKRARQRWARMFSLGGNNAEE